MSQRAIAQKVARMRAGGRPRVLDLFAGCGGLSLGFHAAGFEQAAAVEFDKDAARSHGLNFHKGDPRHSQARDILSTPPEALVAELDLGPVDEAFDVIVGGPPCQAFARVGRSKLREVNAHAEAFKRDPRARLYLEYLHYVDACQPLALLLENVPDVLNHGGQNIAEEICDVLSDKGYVCGYTLLNAAFYGVPQMRERMFLIAYRQEVADAVSFPLPTNYVDLPVGYEGSRQVALKLLKQGHLLGQAHRYAYPPNVSGNLPRAVTAEDALGDLPAITLHREGKLKKGPQRFKDRISYDDTRPVSPYGHLMRSWPGFEARDGLYDHVIRYLPRDYDIFERMHPGDQYPEAHQHALALLEKKLAKLKRQGINLKPGSMEYEEVRKSVVPPYDVGKFPNKWRKMEADKPARTLMAHLGKDSYSHIHYDSLQARTISVREAARLQSFPDGFVFCGTMNPAFRQIGNAVPPLMAKALATEMHRTLMAAVTREVEGEAQSAIRAV